jgi:uncharacterized repeat protein (TIGR02543 family)
MSADKSVIANFTQIIYSLTITQATGGTITAAPAGPYHYGDAVHVSAVGDEGYAFTGWNGDLSGRDNPATIIMDRNKSVTGTFTPWIKTFLPMLIH